MMRGMDEWLTNDGRCFGCGRDNESGFRPRFRTGEILDGSDALLTQADARWKRLH
jgi:hypothetical protein